MTLVPRHIADAIARGQLPPLNPAPQNAAPQNNNEVPQETERFDSGGGTLSVNTDGVESRSVELRFQVHSLSGYREAEQKGRDIAARYYSGHRRSQIRCTAIGAGWYEIEIGYDNAGVLQQGGIASRVETNADGFDIVPGGLSFDTTGQTERVFQAWTDSAYPTAYQGKYKRDSDPEEPWNTYGALNVNENSVQGAEVTVPGFNFTETWTFPSEYVLGRTESQRTKTTPYLKTLYDMTGTVNGNKFRIFETGELLFMGARGDISPSSATVTITFSFSARANRTNFMVNDIKVARKEGWDLLWIEYESRADTSRILKFPRYVFVDKIYPYGAFSSLEIGTAWKTIYLRPEQVDETGKFVHPIDPAADDVTRGK